MTIEEKNRRDFLKIGSAALASTVVPWTASSYAAIVGANDRVRVALIGAGDRAKSALVPAFQEYTKELNFEFVAVSDIWNMRRDQGAAVRDRQHRAQLGLLAPAEQQGEQAQPEHGGAE